MATKKVKKLEEVDLSGVVWSTDMTPAPSSIDPLAVDLGREDLNAVVKKLNEVIAHLNN